MKSTNNQIYLDYNATSPLAKLVINFLAKGDLLFANPSSIHSLGKAANKSINDSGDKLYSFFNLDQKKFNLFYHSGATEGFMTFVNSIDSGDCFLYHSTDHPMVLNAIAFLEARGVDCASLDVSDQGEFDVKAIKQSMPLYKNIYLNWTWVNNETGVVNDPAVLSSIASKNLFIHVDAVQSIGKIPNYDKLDFPFHMISYSGHKFGALKGVGMSFVSNNFSLKSIFPGGGQQAGRRGGTLNELGVKTLDLALTEIKNNVAIDQTRKHRDTIQSLLTDKFKDGIQIFSDNTERAVNTLCFAIKSKKADEVFIHFDLGGVAISIGSACSSQAATKSHVVESMGFKDLSDKSLRISIGNHTESEFLEIKNALEKIITKIKS